MAPDGTIDACRDACCGYRCCDFSAGNYIVLYPGELNDAVAAGASLAHLEIRPSSDGGHRAVCKAGDTATCDGGYKPLDCASYPLFPTIDACGDVCLELTGAKCPLAQATLGEHRANLRKRWTELVAGSAAVARWLDRVRLVGYRRVTLPRRANQTSA